MMPLALALTTAQLDMLRTTAAPVPASLRGRYLERIRDALRGRDSVGDGELHRLARRVAGELIKPQEQRARPSIEPEVIRGFP